MSSTIPIFWRVNRNRCINIATITTNWHVNLCDENLWPTRHIAMVSDRHTIAKMETSTVHSDIRRRPLKLAIIKQIKTITLAGVNGRSTTKMVTELVKTGTAFSIPLFHYQFYILYILQFISAHRVFALCSARAVYGRRPFSMIFLPYFVFFFCSLVPASHIASLRSKWNCDCEFVQSFVDGQVYLHHQIASLRPAKDYHLLLRIKLMKSHRNILYIYIQLLLCAVWAGNIISSRDFLFILSSAFGF